MIDVITVENARELACKHLSMLEMEIGESLKLVDTETLEKPFGWVFFYNSKSYLETGDFRSMLGGNAPFIIDRKNGDVHVTGTVKPIEDYIADFEKKYQTEPLPARGW